MIKPTAATLVILVALLGSYVLAYFAWSPSPRGIRRDPWIGGVERGTKTEEICEKAFAPCLWAETQWAVSKNIGRAEGEWASRDGEHRVEVRRLWGNTFEVSSATGWLPEPVRACGNSPGCGPLVMTDGEVSLFPRTGQPVLAVTVGKLRGTFEKVEEGDGAVVVAAE